MTPTRKFDEHVITTAVGVCAPAARLLVVSAWSDVDGCESGHEVLAVVAIQAEVSSHFSRDQRPDGRRPPTAALAHQQGWAYDGTATRYNLLVLDEEHGVVPLRAPGGANASRRVVAADWSRAEDADRLAAVIAEVEAEAIAAARRNVPGRRREAPALGFARPGALSDRIRGAEHL